MEHGLEYCLGHLSLAREVCSATRFPGVLCAPPAVAGSRHESDEFEDHVLERTQRRLRRQMRLKCGFNASQDGFCLQHAVLRCCDVPMRRRMRLRFLVSGRGSGASGLCKGDDEAANFYAVQEGLAQEGVFVWVVRGASVAGHQACKWRLGDQEGKSVGVLLWVTARRHVHRLVGGGVTRLLCDAYDGCVDDAPWMTSVVTAKKGGGGGFRGCDPKAARQQRG